MFYLPDNIVHTHDILGLIVGIVDYGSTGPHPNPISIFAQKAVVFTDAGSLGEN